MDEIQHKFVEVDGLKLHVAEIGTGKNPLLTSPLTPQIHTPSSPHKIINQTQSVTHTNFRFGQTMSVCFRSKRRRIPARVPGDMVLLAAPDDCRGQGRIPGNSARLQRVRTVRPASPTREGFHD